MTIADFFILFVVGAVTGVINVLAGGGSLITLPVLIFMGLPATVANATNRVGVLANSAFAAAGFRSKGVNTYPYSLYLAIAAFFGAILGAMISIDIDNALFNKIIAIVMVIVAGLTLYRPKVTALPERTDKKATVIGCIVFFFIGIYGGFIQAGVGFLMMAALTTVNHYSLVKTNSAKVFIVLIYTLSAMAVFVYEDVINWGYGLVLAAGNALGGWVTSRWSVSKGDRWVKIILVVMIVVMAVKLWFY